MQDTTVSQARMVADVLAEPERRALLVNGLSANVAGRDDTRAQGGSR